MAIQATRVRRNLKANQGRIIRVEQLVGRLEKRIERLEKQNQALKEQIAKQPSNIASPPVEKQNAGLKTLESEVAKLAARVDDTTRAGRETAAEVSRLAGLREPIRALVRSFKETPGAPFSAWRVWMLSTFRKQGVYRRRMFQ